MYNEKNIEKYPQAKISVIKCYAEEYKNRFGENRTALRDKETDAKVILTGEHLNKEHFVSFLIRGEHLSDIIMPTIYQKDGDDCIAVTGVILERTESKIVMDVNSVGGYCYI